jgi:hypothetical protein
MAISRHMTEKLKIPRLNFETSLQDVCKQLIEQSRVQFTAEITEYFEKQEKYAMFKEFSRSDHENALTLVSPNFIPDQSVFTDKEFPSSTLSLLQGDLENQKTFKLFSCQCKFNELLMEMMDLAYHRIPLVKI